MELSLCLTLLMLALVGMPGGLAGDSQQNRLLQKLEKISNQLEDGNKILFGSMKSLQQHSGTLHRLADEIDKLHKEFTDEMIINSGVVVGGDILHIGGVAWEFFKKGSPVVSLVGMGLSLLGRYRQESTWSEEQKHNHKFTDFADHIFMECEETLQEVADVYQEMQWKLKYLEEEKESVSGTTLHKKINEIQIAFSHFQPPRIKKQFLNSKNGLFNFLLNLAIKSGAVSALREKGVLDLVKPTSVAISKKGTSAVKQVSKMSKFIYFFEAVSSAVDLYSDGNELYKEIVHRDEGARSELAKSVRTMAANLEAVTQSLHSVLSKGK